MSDAKTVTTIRSPVPASVETFGFYLPIKLQVDPSVMPGTLEIINSDGSRIIVRNIGAER